MSRRKSDARRYALAYARVSDPRQAQKDVSVPEQLREIRAYAEKEDIVILQEFADRGRSAYRDDVKREEFEKMIRLAKEDPRISLILVHESSRFVRRRAKAVLIKSELAQQGVKVVPVLNPYDSSTIAGFWLESIDETRAEAESMAISMHVLEKMKGNIGMRDPETGWCYKNGGRAPAGYKNVRVVRGIDCRGREIVRLLWEIDEEWGPRAQFIVRELKLKQNLSFKKIRDYCNQQGWLTPEGNPVTTSFIREFFREDRLLQLAGYAFWNREDRATRGRRFKPKEEWVKIAGAHPALIAEEEAVECRRLIEASRGFNALYHPQEESRWLLTGKNIEGEPFFVCTYCGSNVIGDVQGGRHALKYHCSTAAYEGKYTKRCIYGVKLPKEEIEEHVISEIRKRFGAPERIKDLVRQFNDQLKQENRSYQATVIFLEKQIGNIKTQIGNLINAIAKGTPPEYVNPEVEKLKGELNRLEKQKETIKPAVKEIDEEKVISHLCRLDDVLNNGTNKEKRRYIRAFIRKLEFDPVNKKVTIIWHHDPLKKTHFKEIEVCGNPVVSEVVHDRITAHEQDIRTEFNF